MKKYILYLICLSLLILVGYYLLYIRFETYDTGQKYVWTRSISKDSIVNIFYGDPDNVIAHIEYKAKDIGSVYVLDTFDKKFLLQENYYSANDQLLLGEIKNKKISIFRFRSDNNTDLLIDNPNNVLISNKYIAVPIIDKRSVVLLKYMFSGDSLLLSEKAKVKTDYPVDDFAAWDMSDDTVVYILDSHNKSIILAENKGVISVAEGYGSSIKIDANNSNRFAVLDSGRVVIYKIHNGNIIKEKNISLPVSSLTHDNFKIIDYKDNEIRISYHSNLNTTTKVMVVDTNKKIGKITYIRNIFFLNRSGAIID